MRDQLETTYRTHRQGLFTLALSITGCRQLAEDAVHGAFERLCRRETSTVENLSNYVFACVRNSARDLTAGRKRDADVRESIFNGAVLPKHPEADPAADVLTKERDQILRAAIESLTEDEREIVILKAFGGLTFDDAGEALEESPKTVATRYRRALMKLEEKLQGQL